MSAIDDLRCLEWAPTVLLTTLLALAVSEVVTAALLDEALLIAWGLGP